MDVTVGALWVDTHTYGSMNPFQGKRTVAMEVRIIRIYEIL